MMCDQTIGFYDEKPGRREQRSGEVRSIADVLAELLQQYRARFPQFNVVAAEPPPTAA